MANILILGAGMMGSAMSVPAIDNPGGNSVRIMGTPLDGDIIRHALATGAHLTMNRPLPEGVRFEEFGIGAMERGLDWADILICGVSSFGVDWFGETVAPRVPERLPVLSVTKGLADNGDGTLTPFPRLWEKAAGSRVSFNAIGGPCTSYELADRRHSSVVFCGGDVDVLRRLKAALTTDYYHISLSTDVDGVERAAALKNAFALAVTLAVGMTEAEDGDGCAQAFNPQAALFGQSVREMSLALELAGADQSNLPYGAGDLYVTIYGGRTRKLGALLGRGLPFDQAMARLDGVTLESVVIARRVASAIRVLADKGQARMESFPLLAHVDALLSGAPGLGIPWRALEIEP
ncbi:MAG: glycerol-3-phosphate dehydrogenase [Oscillospiraceae bacterium]|jgi:glycerol-3-phosphate dehydrogenase (NAD(P)+)|nr:glycerol-3-phosphate dehydrogenase [Oscillospiraceae bacterium]